MVRTAIWYRKSIVFVVLALLPVLFLSSPAAPATRRGMRAGKMTLYPALSLKMEYDSNITVAPENEVDDIITYVSPSILIYMPVEDFFLQLSASGSFVRYKDSDREDNDIYKLTGSLGGDFPGGLTFAVADTYSRNYLKTMREFDIAEYFETNQFYAKLGYTTNNRFRFEAEYFNYLFAYEESNDLDRGENTFAGTIYAKLLPKTAFLLEAGVSGFGYTDSGFQYKDNYSWQVRGGITWTMTGKTTGEFRLGFHQKKYDEEGLPDRDNFVAIGRLKYNYSPKTSFNIELLRSTVESDYIDNPHYLTTRLKADMIYQFSSKISATAGLMYRHDEYPVETAETWYEEEQSEKRDDDSLGGHIGLDYDILQWLTISGDYMIEKRDSNLDTFDFDITRVSLSLKGVF